jgi:hypothetical protein
LFVRDHAGGSCPERCTRVRPVWTGKSSCRQPAKINVVDHLDVDEHVVETFGPNEFAQLRTRLATYDILGAVEIRPMLRALGLDPGVRRLAELGPPQKTRQLNQRGRTLEITTTLLVQGSCGISRPFADPSKLNDYVIAGDIAKLHHRLEADAKSLYAMYEYGRLHGSLRLRWGYLDERLAAPWVHRDEPTLHTLMRSALAIGVPLEVVVGNAPGWADPWARRQIAVVRPGASRWETTLVDEQGLPITAADVQRARLAAAIH